MAHKNICCHCQLVNPVQATAESIVCRRFSTLPECTWLHSSVLHPDKRVSWEDTCTRKLFGRTSCKARWSGSMFSETDKKKYLSTIWVRCEKASIKHQGWNNRPWHNCNEKQKKCIKQHLPNLMVWQFYLGKKNYHAEKRGPDVVRWSSDA